MTERSEQDADQHIEQRLREIEVLREAAQQQGFSFAALTEEELYRKVRGEESGEESSHSPYIYAQHWSYSTAPGSSAHYEVHIANPDPRVHAPLFVSVFFGVANFLDDIGEGISGRDQRWPYLSSEFFGLAAGATTNQAFKFTLPFVPPSTYIGNVVLWKGELLGKGDYFDQAFFWIILV